MLSTNFSSQTSAALEAATSATEALCKEAHCKKHKIVTTNHKALVNLKSLEVHLKKKNGKFAKKQVWR